MADPRRSVPTSTSPTSRPRTCWRSRRCVWGFAPTPATSRGNGSPRDRAGRRPLRRNVVPGAYRGVAVSSVECDARRGAPCAGTSSDARPIAEPGSSSSAMAARRPSSQFRRRPRIRCSRPSRRCSSWSGPPSASTSRNPRWTPPYPPRWRRRPRVSAPDKRGVVVQGRYGHVSFIIDPAPLRVTVREVVPPYPAEAPRPGPARAGPRRAPAADRAGPRRRRARPAGAVPDGRRATSCRAGVVEYPIEGATTDYLDEHPDRATVDADRLRAVPADPRVVLRRARRAGRHLSTEEDRRHRARSWPSVACSRPTSRSTTVAWSCRGEPRWPRSPRR